MSRLAILSDTHDQIANLRAAIDYCNGNGVTLLLHCGDLISPFMLKELTLFQGAVHLIFGNNVGDQKLISARCSTEFPNITHHGILGEFSHKGLQIAMLHYPEQARALASLSRYDIVCCGHSHCYKVEEHGKTLLINPGQLLGENDQAGFAVLDLDLWKIQRVRVGGCMFDREIVLHSEPAATLPGRAVAKMTEKDR